MLFYVIDDEESVRKLIARVIRQFPAAEVCEFESAEAAQFALRKLQSSGLQPPAMIVTDIYFPGISGVAFCQWIKTQPSLVDVPVIVVSGQEGEAILQQAFAAGAHDFIRKPLVVYELEARLQAAVRLSTTSATRRAATAMAERELFFSQAVIASISNMGVGLLVIDQRRLTFVNPALCRLTGFSEPEVYSWPEYLRIFYPSEQARITSNHERRLRGEQIETRYETALQCKDGSRLDIEFSVSLWQVVGHEGVICLVRDIREELAMHRQLREMAEHDALTGLPNRRLMQDRLTQALLRCTRAGAELALLFIDLDGFKAINDQLGHAAGDELLRQVAARLQSALRASDTAARLAGDEFVLILGQDACGHLDAQAVAEKLLLSLRQPFELEQGVGRVSASIGIVKSRGEPDTAESILHRADLAMYHVKQRGKDNYWLQDENELGQ